MFIQECTIEISVKPGDRKSVALLPLHLTMNQSLDMVLFTITNYDLLKNPGEGIRMTITLKRKIMSEMMTTYFPSLLLMMITYAQGGRTWQPFVGGKNGHENFRQAYLQFSQQMLRFCA